MSCIPGTPFSRQSQAPLHSWPEHFVLTVSDELRDRCKNSLYRHRLIRFERKVLFVNCLWSIRPHLTNGSKCSRTKQAYRKAPALGFASRVLI